MRGPRPRRIVLDVLVAAVVLGATLGSMSHQAWGRADTGGGRDLDPLGVGLGLVVALPLVLRRRAPLPVLVVVTLATGALYGLDYRFPPLGFAVALYSVARRPELSPARLRV